ncbi:MAG: fumarylacetoacetase [Actinomycetota bacterium]|nr:fumarylacetoacetase [Actinomycetota bacterium]
MTGRYTLENLPLGSVRRGPGEPQRLCVALGSAAVELGPLARRLSGIPPELIDAPNLDKLLAAGAQLWTDLRGALQEVLADGAPPEASFPMREGVPCLPFTVGDYVDFYSSIEHAMNLGRMFRPGVDPLLPNWRYVPVGYHGRSSTVVVSGTPVRRPRGQRLGPDGPSWGPSARLDFELELGFVTGGSPNKLGEPISIDAAPERIFGFVLVNDWSARDIQAWEYQPLGPFLGKSFATSISPWVVPFAALETHRIAGPVQDPEPFEYLRSSQPWAFDIDLEVELQLPGGPRRTIARTNARELYWSPAQQLAHVSSNGAVIRPGDLYASGTISGAEPGAQGSLIELTWNGERPLQLNGQTRTFLEDGDTVTISGWSRNSDAGQGLTLGQVTGQIVG